MGNGCGRGGKEKTQSVAKASVSYKDFQTPQQVVRIERFTLGNQPEARQPLMVRATNGVLWFGFVETTLLTHDAELVAAYLEKLVAAHISLGTAGEEAANLVKGIEGARQVWCEDYTKIISKKISGTARLELTFAIVANKGLPAAFLFGNRNVFSVIMDKNEGVKVFAAEKANWTPERFCFFSGEMKETFARRDNMVHTQSIEASDRFLIVCGGGEPEQMEKTLSTWKTSKSKATGFTAAEELALALQDGNDKKKVIVVPLNISEDS